MSIFTWTRAISAASVSSGPGVYYWAPGPLYSPGTATTFRRRIVDWGIQFGADGDFAPVNTDAKITLALITTGADDDTPAAPDYGPGTNLTAGYDWWQGAWYEVNLSSVATTDSPIYGDCHGRIDLRANADIDPDEYTRIWFGVEVNDVDTYWTQWQPVAWFNCLTAPTGS